MKIDTQDEYEAVTARIRQLEAAGDQSGVQRELTELVRAAREWEGRENVVHGPEDNLEPGTNISPDDMSVSGLPGNLGKLHKN